MSLKRFCHFSSGYTSQTHQINLGCIEDEEGSVERRDEVRQRGLRNLRKERGEKRVRTGRRTRIAGR